MMLPYEALIDIYIFWDTLLKMSYGRCGYEEDVSRHTGLKKQKWVSLHVDFENTKITQTTLII